MMMRNLPVAKSILSNEIFIINLCLALSIYCFPDGVFLYTKKKRKRTLK